jgi:VanZ family protein
LVQSFENRPLANTTTVRRKTLGELTSFQTFSQRAASLGAWLGWMGLIFYLSTKGWGGHQTESFMEKLLTDYLPPIRAQLSRTDLDTLNYAVRKLAHFTEYAILTTLGYGALSKALNQVSISALRYALLVSILFAISDEFHQAFEPGRTSLITDVFIDSLGASVAAFLLLKFAVRPRLS